MLVTKVALTLSVRNVFIEVCFHIILVLLHSHYRSGESSGFGDEFVGDGHGHLWI